MPKPADGFTLVELLVVITIMGLVGVYALSNYNTFGEEQKEVVETDEDAITAAAQKELTEIEKRLGK